MRLERLANVFASPKVTACSKGSRLMFATMVQWKAMSGSVQPAAPAAVML